MEMIKGYNEAEIINDGSSSILPKGAYQMIILGVHMQNSKSGNGKYIEFDLDVAEGEYKGFFDKLYSEAEENKVWRCRYYVNIPLGDGSDKDAFKLRMFKTFINNVEDSNSGYTWNWNEDSLTGKLVGGLVVNQEFVSRNGEVRSGTVLAKTCPIQDVIDGTYRMPNDKKLPSFKNQFKPVEDMELPFD